MKRPWRFLRLAALLTAAAIALSCARQDYAEVQILQTTDIHGWLTDSDVMDAGGGWLRIASLIEQQRREFPPQHTLLIDCGDTVQGTFAASITKGEIPLTLLDALNYDVWIPGNHELDFGVLRFAEMCGAQETRILCGNLSLDADDGSHSFTPWRLFKCGNAEIAVIGMTASYLNQWFWGAGAAGYTVNPAAESIAQILPEILMQKPDMIVLAIHQGWMIDDPREVNEVTAIAERFPEIDLILGGHTHWEHAGRKIGPQTWYVQAGRHADALGVVRATLDTKRNEVVDIESWLATPDATVPLFEPARQTVAEPLENSAAEAAKAVATIARDIPADGTPGIDCATSELISAAVADATKAQAVIHGRLSEEGLSAGVVTELDLFNLVPYENSIGLLSLTPEELKAIIEEQLRNRGSYVACGLYGVKAVVNQQGQVTELINGDGTPLRGRIITAFNSYTLAGGGGRFPVLREIAARPEVLAKDTALETRHLVRIFAQSNSPLNFSVTRWILSEN
jgi:5'-nucleotidase/UDP-sugar diphosphatase